MGLFRKGKTCITAKFDGTDLVFCSCFRKGKTLFYSRINLSALVLKSIFLKNSTYSINFLLLMISMDVTTIVLLWS